MWEFCLLLMIPPHSEAIERLCKLELYVRLKQEGCSQVSYLEAIHVANLILKKLKYTIPRYPVANLKSVYGVAPTCKFEVDPIFCTVVLAS